MNGPWISRRELTGWMKHDSSFMTSMAITGYAVFEALLYRRSYTARRWLCYALGSVLGTSLGPVIMVERTMKAANYLNITADEFHPFMESVFRTGNGVFLQGNASYQ